MIPLHDLPTLNAILNTASAICLLIGYRQIKQNRPKAHQYWMVLAFIISTFFLISYLYYHAHVGHQKFPDLGWIKTLYLFILIPHVILAAIMVPLILMTFYFAFSQQWTRHKKLARLTFPIWLYVSFSGVLVYLMLCQLFLPRP